MDSDQFHARLAASREQAEDVVALAKAKVESYVRHTKTGKSVHVDSYMRDVKGMSPTDLFKEFKDLSSGGPGNTDPKQPQQRLNRLAQVVAEIRARRTRGEWNDQSHSVSPTAKKTAAAPAAPAAPNAPGAAPHPAPHAAAAPHPDAQQQPDATRRSPDQAAAESGTRIIQGATEAEAQVSPILQDVVKSVGGSFFGFEHRLKQEGSLRRKLLDRITGKFKDTPNPEATAEESISDALRYTAISDAEHNVDMAKQIIAKLKDQGHELIEQDNAWGHGGAYYGINMNFKAPNGTKWELQIHTPDSMQRKDASHFWYDFLRDKNLPEEVRNEAKKRSSDSWIGLERPKGWENFGDLRKGEVHTSDAKVRQGEGNSMPKTSEPPLVAAGRTSWNGWNFQHNPDGTWKLVSEGGKVSAKQGVKASDKQAASQTHAAA